MPNNHLVSMIEGGVWPNALRIYLREYNHCKKTEFFKTSKKCHWTSSVTSPRVNYAVPHFAFFWMGAKRPNFLKDITMNRHFLRMFKKTRSHGRPWKLPCGGVCSATMASYMALWSIIFHFFIQDKDDVANM